MNWQEDVLILVDLPWSCSLPVLEKKSFAKLLGKPIPSALRCPIQAPPVGRADQDKYGTSMNMFKPLTFVCGKLLPLCSKLYSKLRSKNPTLNLRRLQVDSWHQHIFKFRLAGAPRACWVSSRFYKLHVLWIAHCTCIRVQYIPNTHSSNMLIRLKYVNLKPQCNFWNGLQSERMEHKNVVWKQSASAVQDTCKALNVMQSRVTLSLLWDRLQFAVKCAVFSTNIKAVNAVETTGKNLVLQRIQNPRSSWQVSRQILSHLGASPSELISRTASPRIVLKTWSLNRQYIEGSFSLTCIDIIRIFLSVWKMSKSWITKNGCSESLRTWPRCPRTDLGHSTVFSVSRIFCTSLLHKSLLPELLWNPWTLLALVAPKSRSMQSQKRSLQMLRVLTNNKIGSPLQFCLHPKHKFHPLAHRASTSHA